jgi:hypothetical protein
VRVSKYTIDDPGRSGMVNATALATSLLGLNSIQRTHWLSLITNAGRITIDETDTHQRSPLRPFRSHTLLGVPQEFYGSLIAHYLIRTLVHEATLQADVPPDRLSFVNSVCILWDAVFQA